MTADTGSQVGPLVQARRPLPKGTVAVAAGAFLLTLAALLPLYVHDRVALIPASAEFSVAMVDGEAGYLDTSRWAWVDAVELRRVTRVEATAHGNDWSAWEMVVDTSLPDRMIDHAARRVIVDRETGRAVNCCGEHVNGDRAVRQAGLVHHWPAGASEDDYPYYDAEVRSAPVLEFDDWDEVAGLRTGRYTQSVNATQVPDSARPVPASLFTAGAEGTVAATRWLEVTRTFWVEPITGIVVHATEQREETLRPRDGHGEVPLLSAELALEEPQVAANAEQARVRSVLLRALDSWAPGALGPLGALAVLVGLVRAWRARGTGDTAVAGPGTGDAAHAADADADADADAVEDEGGTVSAGPRDVGAEP
ncbi:DUF3068 family protein [Nocardiopsis sp. Huas11]|uniref:DUF3068 domain-containing protein n=1 Tax=Nocardiopsis sp. Huas11 TaxID=2183912 RepID=UPI000EB51160|nr:DUF3068 domain-containing protein [Nocardiopsis sp. Huas11]RKS05307.1 DUF3068 family protein [Nocardiopsis sp. Huas11]